MQPTIERGAYPAVGDLRVELALAEENTGPASDRIAAIVRRAELARDIARARATGQQR